MNDKHVIEIAWYCSLNNIKFAQHFSISWTRFYYLQNHLKLRFENNLNLPCQKTQNERFPRFLFLRQICSFLQ